MDLVRIFQHLKDGSTAKNNTNRSNTHEVNEIENLKQIIGEKDVIIVNNNEKIEELEQQLSELQEMYMNENYAKMHKIDSEESQMNQTNQQTMSNVFKEYEKFIQDVTTKHELLKEEKNSASTHLSNLEFAFSDLVQKYDRAKTVILGYEQNQEMLLKQVEYYDNFLVELENKHDKLKTYANKKINEANVHIDKNEKIHISEMAKMRSKALQNQAKITELQEQLSMVSSSGDSNYEIRRKSVFQPLTTHCLMK